MAKPKKRPPPKQDNERARGERNAGRREVNAPVPLRFRGVTSATWPDLEGLFSAPGGPKHCWCMVWRPMPTALRRTGPAAKKQALARLVESSTPIGLVGYLADEPVAWCSVAPIATYRNFRAGIKSPGEPGVWSLACMWVKRPLRGHGFTEGLIRASVAYARENGATALEAYPVDPDAPSYRFMGLVPTFLRLGFEDLGMAGTRRHVMRLPLD